MLKRKTEPIIELKSHGRYWIFEHEYCSRLMIGNIEMAKTAPKPARIADFLRKMSAVPVKRKWAISRHVTSFPSPR
jgi:hypothetical protein